MTDAANKNFRKFVCISLVLGALYGCNTSKKKIPIAEKKSVAVKVCEVTDTAQRVFKKQSDLQKNVLAALTKSDEKKLISMASCNFLIGPPNSDSGGFNEPRKIAGLLVKTLKDVKWSEKAADYKTQQNLASIDTEYSHELIFRQDKNGKWYWAGYTTSDSFIYHKMLENSQQLEPETTEQ